jgi:hypothetical protein
MRVLPIKGSGKEVQMNEGNPIVGHHAGWGMTTPRTRIQPYKLTAGSIDTMCVVVREKIDIHGVGTDVVMMNGTFTVRRDHPCVVGDSVEPKWGESCLRTEFRSLELSGESPVFGTVRVHLDPKYSSNGMVGPAEDGSLAADCVAHCFPAIELPELGLKLTTNGNPINLASKVVQIPPVGDVARSENSAQLVDEAGNVMGQIVSSDIEVGDVVCSFPLGSTGRREAGTHAHTHHDHPGPSGDIFFAEGPKDLPHSGGHGGQTHEQGGGHGGHSHEQGGGHEEHTHEQGHQQASQTDINAALTRLENEINSVIKLIRAAASQ